MGGTVTILKIWENGGGYIGLEHRCPDKPFEYLIGMFTLDSTAVLDEFDCIDFPAMGLDTCWIYGKDDTVHNTSGCAAELQKQGIKLWKDNDGRVWLFENCLCSRYTTHDEKGNIIMDYCYYAE